MICSFFKRVTSVNYSPELWLIFRTSGLALPLGFLIIGFFIL